jgi:tubulin epsilon
MNNIAANVILNLTSGMRFEGTLNVDLNDITMNMVPFPKHHFLLPSMSPLAVSKGVGPTTHRVIDRLFLDVMGRESQLLKCDPRNSTYLACGLLARGRISGADVARNIATLRPNMHLAYWNEEVSCYPTSRSHASCSHYKTLHPACAVV